MLCMVIMDNNTNQPVGTCGLYQINWPCRRAQYRILVGEPELFGTGIGTAATRLVVRYGFDRVNLEMIYLGVNAENTAAVRAYENAGFVHEGRHRRFIYNNGRYYDAKMMSIVRSDYYAMAKQD